MSHPMDEVETRNALANMAAILRTYYAELLEQGFNKREALKLTMGYQATLMGLKPPEDEG